ncbi:MAG: hypothetical protein A2736_01480 [Candidatus Yanofskybacteria bacterium RIFCSPHIGHO2_01_FULL_41_27]|uniref:Rod shape-determining protein RodA n=2 Tax=Candidatus Yanofskyibacteriota TaxID=1752733 RepID=A0A1F8HTE8_9BACT|nr:MAG: hypothetical protein A2736_01480 [Candidatus Yanofskybacteria bacterium RIFCSPHIGHO2_01_FULL_41_27]OGN10123.1 MAG: hypothetical protein A3C64_00430 [Candidatus Yanofskybacteria bacterium RIFCSPHIGHO2_02_FULL_41_12]OGN21390.1 MAG: hypothetical protein A3B00_00880 [Candidatus Yanofskybacteria bacterium RIFCSPLOWO2_01_FULL_41_33]OGN40857.1 MAG: hypothetical protein A2606_02565 [Candidatus Yanofskybacteria bacterium RIFOXYD1_FULL_42_10]
MALKKNSRSFIRNLSLSFGEIDIPLFAAVAAISLFGIINMYGISGWEGGFLIKQIIFVAAGLFLMFAFSFWNYRYLKNYSLPVLLFYIFCLFLLVLTFYSKSIRGVNSWLVLGGFTFEPAELAKLMMIILMAKYFSQRHVHINELKYVVVSGIYFLLPATIMIIQPDLGSAIIFAMIWMAMLFVAGINKKHLFLILIAGAVAFYVSWAVILHPYQKDRIISFINPHDDPYGRGYNLIQSRVAIGSGYLFGNGLGKGSQVAQGFLPEARNDFIFAATAEQFGFAGITFLMGLSGFILYRILNIGRMSGFNFGKLFSIGMAVFIFSHILVGAAVNIGLMPITGIPFPFISYGGSSMVSIMIGLGILQSIKRYG